MPTEYLIVAHAPLASALRSVALHPFVELGDRVHAVDVQPTDDPDLLLQRLQALVCPDEPWIVLVDVLGASPCNAVRRLVESRSSENLAVVAGVNVPALWRLLCYGDRPLAEQRLGLTDAICRGAIAFDANDAAQPSVTGACS